MKKFMSLVFAASMTAMLFGCGAKTDNNKTTTAAKTEATTEAKTEKATTEAPTTEAVTEKATTEAATTEAATEKATTEAAATEEASSEAEVEAIEVNHEEYLAAEIDTKVTVEAYVQAKQSWWEDKATVYAQAEDGAYFFYNMACSKEDYEKLVPGTKIKATGFKAEWSGEIEIVDATFEILEGEFIAEACDVTDLLGKDELIDHQNEFVAFKGMKVEKEAMYKWDGSGSEGDDLYFDVSVNGNTYTFTVESYLCDKDTDVYKAVQGLKAGDVVDMEGFLYWYEGVNPHITAVTVK